MKRTAGRAMKLAIGIAGLTWLVGCAGAAPVTTGSASPPPTSNAQPVATSAERSAALVTSAAEPPTAEPATNQPAGNDSSVAQPTTNEQAVAAPPVTQPSVAVSPRSVPSPKVAARPTNPASCTLLSRSDAQSLVAGATLQPGIQMHSTDPASYSSSCTYTAPPADPSGQVQLFVTREIPSALEIDRLIKNKFRRVAGIGDQTFEEPDNNSIFVHQGLFWVYLSIPFGADPPTLERGARLIAARLPKT